jgi:hypothetical protein
LTRAARSRGSWERRSHELPALSPLVAAARTFGLMTCLLLMAVGARAEGEPAGRAAAWMPLKPTSLVLKTQSAEFVFVPDLHAWDVSLHAEVFQPPGASANAQLAIPEFSCDGENEFEDACDPAHAGFEHVSARVRDREIALRRSRAPSDSLVPAQNVWTLPLRANAGELVSIEQRYRVPAGESGEGGFSASYLMREATSWARPYGRATFKFSFPARSCLIVEPQGVQRKSRRVSAKDSGEYWLDVVYEAYQWTPTRDLALYFEPCEIVRDTELPGCSAASTLARFFYPPEADQEPIDEASLRAELAKLSVPELERCREAVFAAYESYFKPDELKRLPSHPESGRHYVAALLTAADWSWLRFLDQRLAERAQTKVAPAPAAPAPNPEKHACGCGVIGGRLQPMAAGWMLLIVVAWLRRRRLTRRSV